MELGVGPGLRQELVDVAQPVGLRIDAGLGGVLTRQPKNPLKLCTQLLGLADGMVERCVRTLVHDRVHRRSRVVHD